MKLTNAFVLGAGFANAEQVNVYEQDIKHCIGCLECWFADSNGKCIIRDYMDTFIEKYISADIIIWSFPKYTGGVPSGLKSLIERVLMPLSLSIDNNKGNSPVYSYVARFNLSHQKHILISTCGFWTIKRNYRDVKSIFDLVIRDKYVKIFCAQGGIFENARPKSRLKETTDRYLELVKRAGREFARTGVKRKTIKKLSVPLLPKAVYLRVSRKYFNRAF